MQSLLSDLKTGRVKRHSVRRVAVQVNNGANEQLNQLLNLEPIQVYRNERSPHIQRKLEISDDEKSNTKLTISQRQALLENVLKSPDLKPVNSSMPVSTPNTVKFRRNLHNFSENRE